MIRSSSRRLGRLAEDAAPTSETADLFGAELKDLAKLTREALEDDVIGLRAHLADAKQEGVGAKNRRRDSPLICPAQIFIGRPQPTYPLLTEGTELLEQLAKAGKRLKLSAYNWWLECTAE